MIRENELHYIQDARVIVGHCLVWLDKEGRPGAHCLEDAGLFSAEEARSACAGRLTLAIWPKSVVDKVAVQHVRVEQLEKMGRW